MVETFSASNVAFSILHNPPERTWPDRVLAQLILLYADRVPSSLDPEWEPKDFTDSDDAVRYVPMNSSGHASFVSPGYLGTARLNGCTAVAASFQGKRNGMEATYAFLGHYDSENIRQTDTDGELNINRLLASFVKEQPVRVAIAYSKEHNFLYGPNNHYAPEETPVSAILQQCNKLPIGSSVVAIPYETSDAFDDPIKSRTIGHTFAIGLGGSYKPSFDWNGEHIDVGVKEEFTERRRNAARRMWAGLAAEYADDDFDFEQDH